MSPISFWKLVFLFGPCAQHPNRGIPSPLGAFQWLTKDGSWTHHDNLTGKIGGMAPPEVVVAKSPMASPPRARLVSERQCGARRFDRPLKPRDYPILEFATVVALRTCDGLTVEEAVESYHLSPRKHTGRQDPRALWREIVTTVQAEAPPS